MFEELIRLIKTADKNENKIKSLENKAKTLENKINKLYKAIGLDKNTYRDWHTYKKGDKVVFDNIIYECLEDNIFGDFDSSKWQIVTIVKPKEK